MYIVKVIPLKTGIPKESLTYFTTQDVSIGDVVRVSIRNRVIPAIVFVVQSMKDEKMNIKSADFNLKKINTIVGPSTIPSEFFETIQELKEYYLTNTGVLISTIVPSFIFDSYEKLSKPLPFKKIKSSIPTERLVYQSTTEDRITYYKTYIRGAFAKKESVMIILPTIHELESVYESLRKGIETYTLLIHGGMTQKEQIITHNQIIDEPHPVLILATPGFVVVPRQDMGTIILERESSSAYKTINKPYIDLRFCIEIFAKKIGAKLILGDELLRPETIWRHKNHEFTEVNTLVSRSENKLPHEIVDMRNKIETIGREKLVAVLGDEVKQIIEEVQRKSGHVILFSLKKGIASTTFCNDCKNIVSCPLCKNPLILKSENRKKRIFACNHCNEYFDSSSTCTTCGSWNMSPIGIGTERVAEHFGRLYPDIPIFQFDKDNIKNESIAQKTINSFFKEKKAVLITTELALFYLDQKVDYTVIVSFDSLFTIPNFRIGEKIIRLTSSLASYTEKKLIIQTRNPEEKILQNIISGNFLDWQRKEIEMRKRFNYPPFSTIIKVTVLGEQETIIKAHEYLKENFIQWSPGFIENNIKVKGYESISMILKITREKWYLKSLLNESNYDTELRERLAGLPKNWTVIVDPYDLH